MPTNNVLEIDGDEARGRTACINPMVIDRQDGSEPHVFFCGLWYRDRLVRTAQGWRIADRRQKRSYMFNAPSELRAATTSAHLLVSSGAAFTAWSTGRLRGAGGR